MITGTLRNDSGRCVSNENGTAPQKPFDGQPNPILVYLCAVLLSIVALVWALRLWRTDPFHTPFDYAGDSLLHGVMIKSTIDNGWFLRNEELGAPDAMELYAFNPADNLHLGLAKLLSLITQNPITIQNLLYLIGFPLATLTSLYVLRRYGISSSIAIAVSLLYAFLPYHFMRGVWHLFLSLYYLAPLGIMLALDIALRTNGEDRAQSRPVPLSQAIIICLLIGSSGSVYYPFFSCYLLLVAGALVAISSRSFRPLSRSLLLIAIICLTLSVNLSPSLVRIYRGECRPPDRAYSGAEIFGLKIAQLLLPATGHRVKPLAQLKARYNQAPLVNENDGASLGFFASAGFLFLLVNLSASSARKVSADPFQRQLFWLSSLNLWCLLLGTIGGFSSLFALLVSPLIRSSNRISVYIAFFSLFAVALILQKLSLIYRSGRSRKALNISLISLVLLGLLDQTNSSFVPRYAVNKARYESDRDFIRRVEMAMPTGAMIFQLPYMSFPEHPPINQMPDYDHFRAYIHSTKVRWSYGAMRDSQADLWQQRIAALPTEQMLKELCSAGFQGIYVNRAGYPDKAQALENALAMHLGPPAVVSPRQDLAFFVLSPCKDP